MIFLRNESECHALLFFLVIRRHTTALTLFADVDEEPTEAAQANPESAVVNV